MKLPTSGDLIYIKRNISGIITSGDPATDSSWKYSLTTIKPNQTAIVLKAYNPHHGDRTAELLADPNPGDHNNTVVVILAIGTFIIETIFSADYMDIISSAP